MTQVSKSRNTIVTVVAIYLIVVGILGICGGIAVVTGSSLLGVLGAATEQLGASLNSTDRQNLTEAARELSEARGLLTVVGVVLLVVSVAELIISVGLFQRKNWAWRATIAVLALTIVLSVLGTLFGGSFDFVGTVIAAVIIYLFYTNADVRADLNVGADEKVLPNGVF